VSESKKSPYIHEKDSDRHEINMETACHIATGDVTFRFHQ
jgi:hypothetical protein